MKRIVGLCLAIALLGMGYWVTGLGYERLTQFRQIERLPSVPVHAVLPGEVNLQGQAEPITPDQVLVTPDTEREVVYYRYHIEREVVDSDGDRRWQTVSDTIEYTPFLLRDATGAVLIEPDVRASLPQTHRRHEGDRRYTEYSIFPGADLFVLGYAVPLSGQDSLQVSFTEPGSYTPLLSAYGESRERSTMAATSVAFILLGVAALSAGVFALVWVLQWHKTLMFVLLMALVVFVTLFSRGMQMAKADVEDALSRLQAHEQQVLQLLRDQLPAIDDRLDWTQLARQVSDANVPIDRADRLAAVVDHVLLRQARVADLIQLWPERRFVPADMSVPEVSPQPSEVFQPTRLSFWHTLMFTLGGLLTVGIALPLSLRRIKLKRLMENLPTTHVAGVVFGLNEIQGRAVLPDGMAALTGPLSGEPCLSYRFTIEEQRKSGKSTKWVEIYRDSSEQPFELAPDEADPKQGRLRVYPSQAEFVIQDREVKKLGKQRHTEIRIRPDTPLYVLGPVNVSEEGSALEVRHSDQDQPFIVTDLSEGELMVRKAAQAFAGFCVALIGGVAVALGLAGQSGQFGVLPYLWCATVPLVYWGVLVLILMYNDLVFLRQRIQLTDANINVALKKRDNLLPMLESVTQMYLAHEEELQQRIVALRQQWQPDAWTAHARAELIAQEHQLHDTLLARFEAYPELKADASVRALMHQLTRLEDDIAHMRIGYTQAIEQYNTRRGQLPDILVASLTGFAPADPIKF